MAKYLHITRDNFLINDSTLREGQQGKHPVKPRQGIIFNREMSLKLAEQLVDFGVDTIEVGAPIHSDYGLHTIQQIAEITNGAHSHTRLAIHGRCTQPDLDVMLYVAQSIKRPVFNLYIGTSPENRKGTAADRLSLLFKKLFQL